MCEAPESQSLAHQIELKVCLRSDRPELKELP